MYTLVSKLKVRGSLLDKKPDSKEIALTEGILDVTDARLEMSPRKFLDWCRRQVFSRTFALWATEFLKL
jgi:hypothetical protein